MDEKTRKEQAIAWGKLGGRPKVTNKRSAQLNIKLTPDELIAIEEKAKAHNVSTTTYCRTVLTEKPFPNVQQNKLLLQYAVNFTRISNFMKQGIFNEYEKQYLLDDIQTLITELRKAVKW